MAEFNRYIVTVDVVSAGVEHSIEKECSFSVAAVSESAIPSALPLNQIAHVDKFEITEIEKQND